MRELEQQVRDSESQLPAIRGEGEQLERDVQAVRNRLLECKEQINRCTDQQNNALAPYGQNLNAVLDNLGRQRWHGQKPVGPIGVFVRVKEPNKWAPLLRNVLGRAMSSFAVTDTRDVAPLRSLLKTAGRK